MGSPEMFSPSEHEPIPQAEDKELAMFLAQEIASLSEPGLDPHEYEKKKKFCLEEADHLMKNPAFTDPEAKAILKESLDQIKES